MRMKSLLFGVVAFLFLDATIASAQWEPTGFTESVWVLCKAENGNLIVSDDIYPDMGGIYLSQDQGKSWNKADAGDYAYTSHLVKGESVYLGGVECNVAISHNNGETWSNVSFMELLPGVSKEDPIYAMEYHNGRVYAAVLAVGIVYSDDDGNTWNLTDQESLLDEAHPDEGGHWCYNLRSYKGKLYSVGAYGIWEYDEEVDLWSNVDGEWFAGSSCIADDVLYVAYNAPGLPYGIRYTTDFQEWEVMPIPEGVSTSIRFLKYYNGAFFMGNVQDAVFYTLDKGETWIEYRENFPAFSPVPEVNFYGTPMNMAFSGDNIFCGVFDLDVGGVYWAPIPSELVTGVEETEELLQQPAIYPNPANEFVVIQLPEGYKNHGSLVITDVMGRMKYNKSTHNEGGNEIVISTTDWASGVYVYYIAVNKESRVTGKFIVK